MEEECFQQPVYKMTLLGLTPHSAPSTPSHSPANQGAAREAIARPATAENGPCRPVVLAVGNQNPGAADIIANIASGSQNPTAVRSWETRC
jgi:hypothetical protein